VFVFGSEPAALGLGHDFRVGVGIRIRAGVGTGTLWLFMCKRIFLALLGN
jgi:hypothetical protein